jgi:Cu/Ag efflux pump CusA
VVPFTLLIIFVLLYLTFGRLDEAALLMSTLPFALLGGVWLLWALGHQLSVDGGRHAQRALVVDVRHPGGLPPDAAAPS